MNKKSKINMDDIFSTYKDRQEQEPPKEESASAVKVDSKNKTKPVKNEVKENIQSKDKSEDPRDSQKKSSRKNPAKKSYSEDPMVEIRAKVRSTHRSFIESCKVNIQANRSQFPNKERITLNSVTRAVLEAARLLEPDLFAVKDENDLVDRFIAAMRRFGS